MRKHLAVLAFCLVGFAGALGAQSDRISGTGFFTTVQVNANLFTLKSADAFLDGDIVFFVVDYASSREYDVAFFDPPKKKVVSLSEHGAVRIGEGSLVFSIPAERVSRAPGFTVLIDPRTATQFVYFAVPGGARGLDQKQASEEQRASAIAFSQTAE